jgi:hypothetical protein
MAPRSVRFGVDRGSWSWMGYEKFIITSTCFGRHVKPLAPAAFVVSHQPPVGYGPFSLCVIHKEGLCPSSGGMMIRF